MLLLSFEYLLCYQVIGIIEINLKNQLKFFFLAVQLFRKDSIKQKEKTKVKLHFKSIKIGAVLHWIGIEISRFGPI